MIGTSGSSRASAFLGNNRALSASSGLRRQTPGDRGLSVRVEANSLGPNQWGDLSGPEENFGLTDQAFEREVAGSVCKVITAKAVQSVLAQLGETDLVVAQWLNNFAAETSPLLGDEFILRMMREAQNCTSVVDTFRQSITDHLGRSSLSMSWSCKLSEKLCRSPSNAHRLHPDPDDFFAATTILVATVWLRNGVSVAVACSDETSDEQLYTSAPHLTRHLQRPQTVVNPSSGAEHTINPQQLGNRVILTRAELGKTVSEIVPNHMEKRNITLLRKHLTDTSYISGSSERARGRHSPNYRRGSSEGIARSRREDE